MQNRHKNKTLHQFSDGSGFITFCVAIGENKSKGRGGKSRYCLQRI